MKQALALLLLLCLGARAKAASVAVAVAANFTAPAKEIATAFEKASGEHAVLSFGATGSLATQIAQGAPYDVLLSADQARPQGLVAQHLAVAASRFTYAIGRIVLWSRTPGQALGPQTLLDGKFDTIAICDPKAAPYGEAAVETMQAVGAYDRLKPKLVVGANITQAFQFVQTGNAPLGFVALSQLVGQPAGSRWEVPQDLYRPIRQDAVLLQRGAANPAASAFLAFLKGPQAKAVLDRFGYRPGA